jgi:hypothetical protein
MGPENLSTNLFSDVCVAFGDCSSPTHEVTLFLDSDGNSACMTLAE